MTNIQTTLIAVILFPLLAAASFEVHLFSFTWVFGIFGAVAIIIFFCLCADGNEADKKFWK